MLKRTSILALLLLLIAACTANTPEAATPTAAPTAAPTDTTTPSPVPPTATATPPPTATMPPTPTEGPKASGPTDFPAGINPLTGLRVSDPTLLDRRPVSIKIQLFPRGQRPPYGVSLADIVFDYYQNNGLSRFNAIFYGNNAEKVGPIRSARLLDGHIIRSYKAIFAFGGADQRIYTRLANTEFYDRMIVEGNQSCPYLCREDPNGNNLLIGNTAELSKHATEKKLTNVRQNLDGMRFDPETPTGGEAGAQVFTRFSISAYSRWDYDKESGRYLRFQDTQEDQGQGEAYAPLMDKLTNQQVAADNVVVLLVPTQYAFKSGNSEIIDTLLNGTGTAYAYRDGQVFQVKWSRPQFDSMVTLVQADGKPFAYKPGTTWYEVVGQSSLPKKEEDGIWRFTYTIP